MSKKDKSQVVPASAPAPVEPVVAAPAPAEQPTAPAPAVAEAPKLYKGAKVPSHRSAHTTKAWAAITPLLPASAATLAALPELKVPECGGPKGNGQLFVSYALRRGWLTDKAPAPEAPAADAAPATTETEVKA